MRQGRSCPSRSWAACTTIIDGRPDCLSRATVGRMARGASTGIESKSKFSISIGFTWGEGFFTPPARDPSPSPMVGVPVFLSRFSVPTLVAPAHSGLRSASPHVALIWSHGPLLHESVLGKRLLHTNWRAYCPAPVTPQRQHAFISPVGQRADGRAVVQPVAAHYNYCTHRSRGASASRRPRRRWGAGRPAARALRRPRRISAGRRRSCAVGCGGRTLQDVITHSIWVLHNHIIRPQGQVRP